MPTKKWWLKRLRDSSTAYNSNKSTYCNVNSACYRETCVCYNTLDNALNIAAQQEASDVEIVCAWLARFFNVQP